MDGSETIERNPLSDALGSAKEICADDAKAKPSRDGASMAPVQHTSLADFKRDTDGRNVLIKGRWGVRGTISMHVSTTGSGKSILQTQAALCFNRGVACCGLEPTRPFKTWVIQSEDDDDRVAIDRDDIVAYLAERYPNQDWEAATRETMFIDFTGRTGVSFIETLNAELNAVKDSPEKPDAVIINPWNKFFGGDPMSHKDCSAFLAGGELGRGATEGIESVIKRHGVWLWVFSHTGKPPTKKELRDWLTDPYSCYKMCGSSAVPDAVRSIITFLQMPDSDGLFTFTAGKNGGGLGWKDENGKPTNRTFFQWGANGRHYWRDVARPVAWDAIEERPTKRMPPPRDEMPIVFSTFATFSKPMTKGAAVSAIRLAINADRAKAVPPVKPIGRNDATGLIDLAVARRGIECVECGGTQGTLLALPEVMRKWRVQSLPGMDADAATNAPLRTRERRAQ